MVARWTCPNERGVNIFISDFYPLPMEYQTIPFRSCTFSGSYHLRHLCQDDYRIYIMLNIQQLDFS
jgi:hypothetical protein